MLSFSGLGFQRPAASSSEQYESRVIVSYDIAKQAYAWRTQNSYLTHPALANGVVYAARNAPATLDAMSEVDGHIEWSWTPPAGDSSFHRNIVVTRNLLFVSTDVNVYAIDLVHAPGGVALPETRDDRDIRRADALHRHRGKSERRESRGNKAGLRVGRPCPTSRVSQRMSLRPARYLMSARGFGNAARSSSPKRASM